MRPRTVSRLRHLLGWLVVVVVTATVTTFAVARVGDDVAGELTTAPPALDGTTSGTPTPSAPSIGASARPPSASPSGPEPDDASATAAPGPTSTAGDTSGPTGRATAPGDGDHDGPDGGSREPSASHPPGATSQTFSTPGGVVVAACRGERPYAKSVTPRYGYAFETESDGSQLTVKFTGSDQEFTLHIGCRSGSPVLVESDGRDE